MDTISIKQLKVPTIIGVYPFERELTQTLLIDLEFKTDAKKIAKEDNLKHAIDYEALSNFVLSFGKNYNFQLIETFAEHLAQACLKNFSLSWIKVYLQKTSALKEGAAVTITLERSA